MARIVIDGGSSASGLWDAEAGGWGDRIKRTYMAVPDRRDFVSVINFALSQRMVDSIARDLPVNLQNYAGKGPGRVALFQVGISESRLLDGEYALPPLAFRRALGQIGVACADQRFMPIFLGLPPLDENRTQDFGREKASYTEANYAIYDTLLRDYAQEQGEQALYVDVRHELGQLHPRASDILDKDGLHLNSLGHAALHDRLLPLIQAGLQKSRVLVPPPEPSIEKTAG